MDRVFLGCHYCKAQFWLKNDLYYHWHKSCAKYCPCDKDSFLPVYADMDKNEIICVFFNKTNIHVPVIPVLKQYFPHLQFDMVYPRDSSELPIKRIKLDEDVEMSEV